jgi:hypothetical protein
MDFTEATAIQVEPSWVRLKTAVEQTAPSTSKNLAVSPPLLEVSRAASSIFLCGSWKAGALLCATLLLSPRYFASSP